MVGIRDFFDAFKGSTPGGETAAGTWRYLEKYLRVSGMGEVEADLELPEGEAVISVEEIRDVESLEIGLTGPGGGAVPLERLANDDDSDTGMHNLFRMAVAKVEVPGMHHVRVKAPEAGQELVVLAGEELSATDAMLGTFGRRGDPFKRR